MDDFPLERVRAGIQQTLAEWEAMLAPCRAVGCRAEVTIRPEPYWEDSYSGLDQGLRVQHGDNPEHSKLFTHQDIRRAGFHSALGLVGRWLALIHAPQPWEAP